jgi:hypothetical protein
VEMGMALSTAFVFDIANISKIDFHHVSLFEFGSFYETNMDMD